MTSIEQCFNAPLVLPRTWPELDRLMEFFHDPANDRNGGALFRTPRYVAWEWWMRLHSKDALPFDDRKRPLIAGSAGVAALDELLSASALLVPGSDSKSRVQNWQAFAGSVRSERLTAQAAQSANT